MSNPTSKPPADLGYNVSSLVDRVPEIIEKIKTMIPKKKKSDDTDETESGIAKTVDAEDGEADES